MCLPHMPAKPFLPLLSLQRVGETCPLTSSLLGGHPKKPLIAPQRELVAKQLAWTRYLR